MIVYSSHTNLKPVTELWLRLTLKTPALRAVIVTVWIEKAGNFKLSFTAFSAITKTTRTTMLVLTF